MNASQGHWAQNSQIVDEEFQPPDTSEPPFHQWHFQNYDQYDHTLMGLDAIHGQQLVSNPNLTQREDGKYGKGATFNNESAYLYSSGDLVTARFAFSFWFRSVDLTSDTILIPARFQNNDGSFVQVAITDATPADGRLDAALTWHDGTTGGSLPSHTILEDEWCFIAAGIEPGTRIDFFTGTDDAATNPATTANSTSDVPNADMVFRCNADSVHAVGWSMDELLIWPSLHNPGFTAPYNSRDGRFWNTWNESKPLNTWVTA